MKKHLFLLLLLVAVSYQALGNSGALSSLPEKRILIIYSFTMNFAPDFQLVSAFNRSLSYKDVRLRTKHLELEAIMPQQANEQAYDAKIKPLLPDIYGGKYDVIIPVGQIAINLLTKYAEKIPASTAIVFCGLDIITKPLVAAHANTTGAVGRVSVEDNIELGLHFYPNVKQVVVLSNWSIAGEKVVKKAQRTQQFYPGIKQIYPDNLKTELNTMLNFISQQDENTLVLFYGWFNLDSTNLVSLQYIMAKLEKSRAPVFVLQDPMLWPGAIGGVFTSTDAIGEALAKQVEQVLRGSKASDITISAIPQETVINDTAIKRGRIQSSSIPPRAKIVGDKKFISRETYIKLLFFAALGIVFGALTIGISILFLRLRRVSNKTEAILSHLPVRVVVSDRSGRLLYAHANQLICDNSIGNLHIDLLPHFNDPEIKARLAQVFSTGEEQSFEINFDNKMHRIGIVKIDAKAFGREAALWVLLDIDELYRTQEKLKLAVRKAEEASLIKSQFVATVSHELRTPLNAMLGFSEMLKFGGLTQSEHDEYVNSINLAGNTLLNLINDTLDYSKLDAKRMTISAQFTDVRQILDEFTAIVKPLLMEKPVEFKIRTAPALPPMLLIAPTRIRQILLNLIGNAIKFTDQGYIELTTTFTPSSSDVTTGTLEFKVTDTGIGVKKEKLNVIFEMFVQQDAERDSQFANGSGLGLTIARELARYMGGDLTLESQYGKGSVFTLTLPDVKFQQPEETKTQDLASCSPNEDPLAIRCLVVDDVTLNLRVIKAMMDKIGVAAELAQSGHEALEKMKSASFDVVLTDLHMPVMDGIELARIIRAQYPEVKVVVVTADTETHSDLFDAVLFKPITLDALLQILSH